jgi:S-adenosylmethionine decarboxylase
MFSTKGIHILLELWKVARLSLNDRRFVESVLLTAIRNCGIVVQGSIFRTVDPEGISGIVLMEHSHVSIHTWPEKGYASVEVYTNGDIYMSGRIKNNLIAAFRPGRIETILVERGIERSTTGTSMTIKDMRSTTHGGGAVESGNSVVTSPA